MKPIQLLSSSRFSLLLATQALIAVVLVFGSNARVLPAPGAIAAAWLELGQSTSFLLAWFDSAKVMLLALLLSTGVALTSAATGFLLTGRNKRATLLCFLALLGVSWLSIRIINPHYQPRLALLAWGLTLLMIPAVERLVLSISQAAIDHCRVLGMKPWRITWELMVRGRADLILDMVRQSAAIGWALLTLLESLVPSGSGIGSLLLSRANPYPLATLLAIQIMILIHAPGQDFLLGKLKQVLCPHTRVKGVMS